MSGIRTILVGLFMAIAPVALNYLAAIDWTTIVPAFWAPVVAGIIMIAMRLITTGPVKLPGK